MMRRRVTSKVGPVRLDPADIRRRRLIRLGVASGIVMFCAAGLIRVLSITPFLPVDESANVDYAMQITHGRLPVAAVRLDPEFPGQRHAYRHVSNHPPLYHAMVGPILRLGLHLHYPNVGVLTARLLTMAMGAVAVALIAALGWALVVRDPARPKRAGRHAIDADDAAITPRGAQLVVASSGLLAVLSTFVTAAGIVQNDALATMFLLAMLIPAVQIVRFGPRPGCLAAMAICAGAASLTRVTSIPVVAVAVAAVFVAGWLWPQAGEVRPPRPWPRLLAAANPAVIVVGATAAAAGWFVLLNMHRYGDWTGGAAVDAIVSPRHEPGSDSPTSYLLHPPAWLIQFTQLTGGLDTDISPQPPHATALAYVLIALLLGGLVAAAFRFRQVRIDGRQLLCVLALAATGALCMVEIAVHAADGGGVHGRYLLPAAGAIGLGCAALLLCLPRGFEVAAVGVALGIELYGCVYCYSLRSELHQRYRINGWYAGLKDGMADIGIPAPEVMLSALLGVAIAGLLGQLVVLWLLVSPRDLRSGQQRTAEVLA